MAVETEISDAAPADPMDDNPRTGSDVDEIELEACRRAIHARELPGFRVEPDAAPTCVDIPDPSLRSRTERLV